jgi:hypothetical protein
MRKGFGKMRNVNNFLLGDSSTSLGMTRERGDYSLPWMMARWGFPLTYQLRWHPLPQGGEERIWMDDIEQ